jgi:hypothetical protein
VKRLAAADVKTVLDELAMCLQNASRVHRDSSSNRRLRYLINRPDVLDYLERLVMEEREQ